MDLRLGKNEVFVKDTFCLSYKKYTNWLKIHDTLVYEHEDPLQNWFLLQFSWKCDGFEPKYWSTLIVLAKIACAKVLIFVLALALALPKVETSPIQPIEPNQPIEPTEVIQPLDSQFSQHSQYYYLNIIIWVGFVWVSVSREVRSKKLVNQHTLKNVFKTDESMLSKSKAYELDAAWLWNFLTT